MHQALLSGANLTHVIISIIITAMLNRNVGTRVALDSGTYVVRKISRWDMIEYLNNVSSLVT